MNHPIHNVSSIIANDVSTQADVWSLGITAVELATTRPPYAELHPMRALFEISKNPPPELKGNYSKEFKAFVSACLKADPADRLSAEELLKLPFIKKSGKTSALVKLIEEAKKNKTESEETEETESSDDELPTYAAWDFRGIDSAEETKKKKEKGKRTKEKKERKDSTRRHHQTTLQVVILPALKSLKENCYKKDSESESIDKLAEMFSKMETEMPKFANKFVQTIIEGMKKKD